ncbi:DNA helicase RecQ [Fibrobacter sp.]|uniref:DNA helicase RecQ n=1 Tax=Fibrobacter sp. TaxID=35828 RepID=UPI0038648D12
MPTAHEILKSVFGYDAFRPMQQEIIEHVVSRKDALVLMPTGGGKSICYQIPALMFKGITVVISPLISLMKDQVDALNANGIGADALNSNNEEGENAAIRQRCRAGQTKILYISPERLQREIPWMQQHLNVSLFAIDEAHCISQWGHDFRPEYTQLGGLHQAFPSATVMALTATADMLTKEDIVRQLNLQDFRLFVSSFDRPNLSLDVRRGYSASEKLKAILSIISKHKHESGIIYCLSRKSTEKVAEELINAGVYAKAYHAGLTAEERNNVQEDFINDNVDVVCATIAFGMGIDKSNVRYVIHYNLPKSIESFYQEIGRAGRDSLPSETVLFYNFQDIITLRKFVNESGQRNINSEKLDRMQEYAESQVCRRRILLNYFGENNSSNCGNCDICKHPPQCFNGTILVQKALSAIKRTGEHIGFSMTADILKGTLNDEIVQKGYDKLKTFGVGSKTILKHWHDYLLQMLQLGYIEIAYNENNHLKITESGNEVLFGRKTAELAIAAKAEAKEDAKPKSSRTSFGRAAFSRTSAGNTHSTYAHFSDSDEDNSLFEALRKVRRQIADENNWPAYVVLSDRTLKDLAYKAPISINELQDVFGFGEMKIRKFGQQFVDAICDYMRQ